MNKAMRHVVDRSEKAQTLAYAEQHAEFETKVLAGRSNLCCIGCGKKLDQDERGTFYGGGLLTGRLGFGSAKHDMAMVAILVCDACVTLHGITSSWLDKLHKHFEANPNLEN
jgi:hypothetical protein